MEFPSEQEAVRFERYLKSGSGRAFRQAALQFDMSGHRRMTVVITVATTKSLRRPQPQVAERVRLLNCDSNADEPLRDRRRTVAYDRNGA
jgi:hypothetical protein